MCGPAGRPVLGVVGMSSLASASLAGGVLWRGNPLLERVGYWRGVVIALLHPARLRMAYRDSAPGQWPMRRTSTGANRASTNRPAISTARSIVAVSTM